MLRTAVATLVALTFASSAFAAAPPPARPVPADLYSGRWYEIARTPNPMQQDCQGSTSEFSGWAAGAFKVVQTCHKGSPAGPAKTFAAHCAIVPGSGNAKLKMSFFGGLVSQEYWILDRAQDNAWAIMATPGGHYVWLLSREPSLPDQAKARALERVRQLGYDLARLAFPRQLAR